MLIFNAKSNVPFELPPRRAGRGRPRRLGGDSSGFAGGESGAGNSTSAAAAEGALGMSTEMELSLGEATSGRRVRRGAAGREARLLRPSRHYTDVEIGDGEEGDEAEYDQVALQKKNEMNWSICSYILSILTRDKPRHSDSAVVHRIYFARLNKTS